MKLCLFVLISFVIFPFSSLGQEDSSGAGEDSGWLTCSSTFVAGRVYRFQKIACVEINKSAVISILYDEDTNTVTYYLKGSGERFYVDCTPRTIREGKHCPETFEDENIQD